MFYLEVNKDFQEVSTGEQTHFSEGDNNVHYVIDIGCTLLGVGDMTTILLMTRYHELYFTLTILRYSY